MLRLRHHSLPCGLLASVISLAAFASPAHAGLLVSSARDCPAEPASQPFTPWLDYSSYTLLPGGSFESGQPGWALRGGASVVAGNESFAVGSPSDSSSLSLPGGSSATSPVACVGVQNPTLRLFARNTGSATSTLQVSVQFQSLLGAVSLPFATLGGGASWQPTLPLAMVVNLLGLGSQTPVTVTFTPQGNGGAWQIDDVYLDPWQRG